MANAGVLLLDDDDDLREALCDLVPLLTGQRCLALASLAELIARRDEALGCTMAIIDINLGPGQPSGLDAYAWLVGERFGGGIAFLTGHARSHPLVARAATLGAARVYQKPIDLQELRELLGAPATSVTV
ncbi:MAG: response regulator [Polyangia bacterium]